MADDNDDANLADAANEPPADPGPSASSAYGTNANDIPGNPPGPMANFDASQTVDSGINENPAHWGANADMQLGKSTGKTSTGEQVVDDNSDGPPDTPERPNTPNPDPTDGTGA